MNRNLKINISPELLGVLFALTAFFGFAFLNCMIRITGKALGPVLVISYRSLFSVCIGLFFLLLLYGKKHKFVRPNLLNVSRGSFESIGLLCWTVSIMNLPLAQVVSLSYILPILSSVLAVMLLKERMTRERILSLLFGSIGVYVLIMPNTAHYNVFSLLVLATALVWALSNIVTKKLTSMQQPLIIYIYSNIFIFMVFLPVNFMELRMMTVIEFKNLLLLSFLSCVSNILMIYAIKHARISVIAPFDYMRLIFTAVLAYMLFDEAVHSHTLIGGGIILFASLFLGTINFQKKLKS